MKEAHFILQGKGGVGKSFGATILAQYMKEKAVAMPVPMPVHCYDTDTVSHTFGRYGALDVEKIQLFDGKHNINSRVFDGLMEQLISEDGIAVVDNGASTFVPLVAYMMENRADEFLAEQGVRLIVHAPIAGGQSLDDCLTGLYQSLSVLRTAEIVVWLNERLGKVQNENGQGFLDFPVFKEHKKRFIGSILTGNYNPDTYGEDIQQMMAKSMTFAEVDASPDFGFMPKQRMRTLKRELWEQLAVLPIAVNEQADGHESEK